MGVVHLLPRDPGATPHSRLTQGMALGDTSVPSGVPSGVPSCEETFCHQHTQSSSQDQHILGNPWGHGTGMTLLE